MTLWGCDRRPARCGGWPAGYRKRCSEVLTLKCEWPASERARVWSVAPPKDPCCSVSRMRASSRGLDKSSLEKNFARGFVDSIAPSQKDCENKRTRGLKTGFFFFVPVRDVIDITSADVTRKLTFQPHTSNKTHSHTSPAMCGHLHLFIDDPCVPARKLSVTACIGASPSGAPRPALAISRLDILESVREGDCKNFPNGKGVTNTRCSTFGCCRTASSKVLS
jgi:hypothetical protein